MKETNRVKPSEDFKMSFCDEVKSLTCRWLFFGQSTMYTMNVLSRSSNPLFQGQWPVSHTELRYRIRSSYQPPSSVSLNVKVWLSQALNRDSNSIHALPNPSHMCILDIIQYSFSLSQPSFPHVMYHHFRLRQEFILK